MMSWARRELAISHGTHFAPQGLLTHRDAELFPNPLSQITQRRSALWYANRLRKADRPDGCRAASWDESARGGSNRETRPPLQSVPDQRGRHPDCEDCDPYGVALSCSVGQYLSASISAGMGMREDNASTANSICSLRLRRSRGTGTPVRRSRASNACSPAACNRRRPSDITTPFGPPDSVCADVPPRPPSMIRNMLLPQLSDH